MLMRTLFSANRCFQYILAMFFFSCLVFPTVLQAIRGVLLGLILLVTVFYSVVFPYKWAINSKILVCFVVTLLVSLLEMIWGGVNGTPGALRVGSVYVVWPILYMWFIGWGGGMEVYVLLAKALILSILFSAFSGLALVASCFVPWFDVMKPYFNLMGESTGLFSGHIAYALTNMTTVIYGVGYLISLMLIGKHPVKETFGRKWWLIVNIALILSLASMLVSGRKAFWIVSFASVPISFLFFRYIKFVEIKTKNLIVLATVALPVIVVMFYAFELNVTEIFKVIASGFNFSDRLNESAWARTEQYYSLLEGWARYPLVGNGHGAAASVLRGSEDQPWAYELSYLALLFQVGLVGFLAYASATLWIFNKCLKICKADKEYIVLFIPPLVGLACFLIANATNPYLNKFDYLWTVFLPIAVINSYQRKREPCD